MHQSNINQQQSESTIGTISSTATISMSGVMEALQQNVQVMRAEHDEEGVSVYQAFKDEIADWALEHQRLGGPAFRPQRMTWIKPSFAWMLYRSGYGRKQNQTRILKIKLSHDAMAHILSSCVCGHGHGGTRGRIQWDPERDIMTSVNGKEPRKMTRTRAIQIGISKELSEYYVNNIVAIEEVTELARRVGAAHKAIAKQPKQASEIMAEIVSELPAEEPYEPCMDDEGLAKIGLRPGPVAMEVAGLGLGKAVR